MEMLIDEAEIAAYLPRVELILDARTPAEFEEDHVPGAINVPVLTDEQRHEVGTLYKTNAFEARKLGATYITLAIHRFLETDLAKGLGKGCRMMIYCARGGQRSGSLGVVLSQIGFPVFRLTRGYKSYRAYVQGVLDRPLPGPVYVLYGYTGSGKTRILEALEADFNVLDLEGLAHHRGSLLGAVPGLAQPSQCGFESALAAKIAGFRPGLPILIEGESRKVGRMVVPRSLFEQMKKGRHLWLDLPREARVQFILEDYHELKDPHVLREPLLKLDRYLSKELMVSLREHMGREEWAPLVENLLVHHYDPLYGRPNKNQTRQPLSVQTLAEAIDAVRALLRDPAPLDSEP